MYDQLTDREKAFVAAVVATGGTNHTEAARLAGYAGSDIRNTAYRLMHKPKILEAIKEECEAADRGLLPLARARLQDLVANPQHKDHFPAVKFLLGCLGVSPVMRSEHKKTVTHTASMPALEELKLLASQLRGIPAPAIDVTPEKIEW